MDAIRRVCSPCPVDDDEDGRGGRGSGQNEFYDDYLTARGAKPKTLAKGAKTGRKSIAKFTYFMNPFVEWNEESEVVMNHEEIDGRVWQLVDVIERRQGRTEDDMDGGLYTGVAGIGYMYLHLAQVPRYAARKKALLEKAESWISLTLSLYSSSKYRGSRTDKCAFLLGSCGVWAVGAVISAFLGNEREAQRRLNRFLDGAEVCLPINFYPNGSDEMLVGRAGYLMGIKWLSGKVNDAAARPSECTSSCCRPILRSSPSQLNKESDWLQNVKFKLLNTVVESGIQCSQKLQSSLPLMYTYYRSEYLGAAHGLGGILFALLQHRDWLEQSPHKGLIKRTLDKFVTLQTSYGNFTTTLDQVPDTPTLDERIQWCHGSPGIAFCFARAFGIWRDPKFLDVCLKTGELVWERGLLWKGPGICHGISGSGYLFILLYRLTGDPKHLYRAREFQDFMFSEHMKQCRTPDTPYSLYEGLAGTACFVADLLHPKEASFPFMDTFI